MDKKQAIRLLASVSIFIFIYIAFTGLWESDLRKILPWSGIAALLRYLGWLALFTFVVIVISKKTNQCVVGIAIFLCVFLVALSGSLWSVFVSAWFFMASYFLGRRVLASLAYSSAHELGDLTALLVGAGVYGSLVGVLAHYPCNYQGIYVIGLLLPVLLERRDALDICVSIWNRLCRKEELIWKFDWINVCTISVASVYVLVAMLPEVGYDPLVTHLFVPSQLADRHLWGFNVSLYALAVIPMMADWIFSINYMLGGEIAARFANVGFIFILVMLVHELTIWAGGSERAGKLAGLILLSTPLTFLEGSTLHVEGVWAAFLIGAILLILKVTETRKVNSNLIVGAGILLGCSLATKALTLLMLPVVGGILIWKWRFWARCDMLGAITMSLATLTVLGSIPYFDALQITGNPVFPFFNKVFKSPFFQIENFKDMRWQAGVTADMLYAMTFHSERYQEARSGAPGFQWLILLIPSILLLFVGSNKRGGGTLIDR